MIRAETCEKTITVRIVEDRNHAPVTPREYDFVDLLDLDPDEIEDALKKAQIAVQNPTQYIQGIEFPEGQPNELQFTKNAVCVTLKGPEYNFSLSMIDLPGIVRDTQENENFVTDLVTEYISHPSAILMPVFPANNDLATQSAWQLVKRADRGGDRTVAVITKIDCIPRNMHADKARLVRNETAHQLENGFYLIRNPETGNEADLQHADEIEVEEIQKLRQMPEWQNVPRERFGLRHLGQKLSELQNAAFREAWPTIKEQLEAAQFTLSEYLRELPPPPDDGQKPAFRLFKLIMHFSKLFSNHADVNDTDNSLYQGQLWNIGQFDKALLYTRPIFEFSFSQGNVTPFDPIKQGMLQTFAWKDPFVNNVGGEHWSVEYKKYEKTFAPDDLSQIIQDSQGGVLVPNFNPLAIVKIVQKRQKEKWLDISYRLLEKNYEWISFFMNKLIKREFSEFPRAVPRIQQVLGDLFKKQKITAQRRLKDFEDMEHMAPHRSLFVVDEAKFSRKSSKYYLRLRIASAHSADPQQGPRYIDELVAKFQSMWHDANADEDSFNQAKTELIDELKRTRTGSTVDPQMQHIIDIIQSSQLSNPISAPTASQVDLLKNLLLRQMPPIGATNQSDPNLTTMINTIHEQSIVAASNALAYWKIAHSRFREYVPRAIEYYLLSQFSKNVEGELLRGFGMLNPDIGIADDDDDVPDLDDILSEDPQIVERRNNYMEREQNLRNVLLKAHAHFASIGSEI